MTAEIVNLRKARKAKQRAARQSEAAGNRALHGRTKAERQRDEQTNDRIRRELDGARRTSPDRRDGDDGQ